MTDLPTPIPRLPSRPIRCAVAVAVALAVAFLPASASAKKQKKTLSDVGVIAGKVVDVGGTTLDGIQVAVASVEPGGFEGSTETGKNGEFLIQVPRAEGDYRIELTGDGYAPFEATVNLGGGEQQNIEFRMIDAATGRKQEAREAYNQGVRAFNEGEVAVAGELFRQASKLDPELPEPHLGLAEVKMRNEDYAAAAVAVDRYLELRPGEEGAQSLAYEAHSKAGNEERAAELREALGKGEKGPDLAVQTYNEGAVAFQKGELETAIAKFQAAIELDPELPNAYAGLASAHYNREEYEKALEMTSKLLELDPESVPGRRIRFLVHDSTGDREAAMKAFEAYHEVAPDAAIDLLYRRADLDFRGSRPEAAKAALLEILELDPDFARAHYTLGLIYANTDTAKAREHLQKFLDLSPKDPEAGSAKEMLEYF